MPQNSTLNGTNDDQPWFRALLVLASDAVSDPIGKRQFYISHFILITLALASHTCTRSGFTGGGVITIFSPALFFVFAFLLSFVFGIS